MCFIIFFFKAEVTNVLRKMYGDKVPEPKKVHCTKWFSNPYTLGAYHCIVNDVTRADLNNLSRRVRNLYFAGTLKLLLITLI